MARLAFALCVALAPAVQGCWSGHSAKTPQQQFLEALNRGQGAQANQIWFGMSDEDRAKFRRGEGLSPSISPEQVQQQTRKRLSGADEPGESGSAEVLTPDLGGGLSNLPSLMAPRQAPPPRSGDEP